MHRREYDYIYSLVCPPLTTLIIPKHASSKLHVCLSCYFYCFEKHHDHSNIIRRGYFSHIFTKLSIREGSQGWNSSMAEHRGMDWCGNHGRMLLIGLLFIASSGHFLGASSNTSPSLTTPTRPGPSPINH